MKTRCVLFVALALLVSLLSGLAWAQDDLIRPEECPCCPSNDGWMMFEGSPAFIPRGFLDAPDAFKSTKEFLKWIGDPESNLSDEQRTYYRDLVERFIEMYNRFMERNDV